MLLHCRKAGIKRAAVVSYLCDMDIAGKLRDAGIKTEVLCYRQHRGFGFLEKIEADAMHLVLRRFRRASDVPEFVFVYDDFTFRGVLAAFASLGIRVPEDVKVVGFANRMAAIVHQHVMV